MQVTYFVGAGASYYSLPIIETMNVRMKAFSHFLKDQKQKGTLKNDFADQFIKDLDELIQIDKNRTSIDAYARELVLKGTGDSQMKLLHLKAILSSYIVFEQLLKPDDLIFYSDKHYTDILPNLPIPHDETLQEMIRTHIDKRYYTFWGDHLTPGSDELPNNIKVLSWNYDMQFESSYSHIKHYSLELTQQNLQVFPSVLKGIDSNKSCILKLNGTAGLIHDNSQKKIYNLFDPREHKLMENLDFLIEILKNNYHRAFSKPLFYFAWETEEIVNQTRQLAINIIKETEILVIIGYSFPSFNKSVDKQIFSDISKLKKIYYQAPNNELPELIDRLNGINTEMQHLTKGINNLRTFYFPTEI